MGLLCAVASEEEPLCLKQESVKQSICCQIKTRLLKAAPAGAWGEGTNGGEGNVVRGKWIQKWFELEVVILHLSEPLPSLLLKQEAWFQ